MDPILQNIRNKYYKGDIDRARRDIFKLLLDLDIKIRNKDGAIAEINISIPTSNMDVLIIGLRYIKNNETITEDHFECYNDPEIGKLIIIKHYRGELELKYPEYKGTHKYQADFKVKDPDNPVWTSVNTITDTLFKK
jgi:hypothetical protein